MSSGIRYFFKKSMAQAPLNLGHYRKEVHYVHNWAVPYPVTL